MVAIIKNFSWQAFERVVSGFYVLFVHALLARQLGVNSYGEFAYLLTIVAILVPFAGMGADIIFANRHVKRGRPKEPDFSGLIELKIVMAVAIVVCLYLIETVFGVFSRSVGEQVALFVLSLTLVTSSFSLFESFFQVEERGRDIALIKLLSLLISSPIKIGAILFYPRLDLIALSFLFEQLVICFLYLRIANIRNFEIGKAKAKEMLSCFKEGMPIVGASMLVGLYVKVDELMIANLLGKEELAYYAAATKLVILLGSFPALVAAVFFPRIASKNNDFILYKKSWTRLFSILFYTSLLVSGFLVIFSDVIISMVFGGEYMVSSTVLNIYSWALVFIFMGAASTRYMLFEGMQLIAFYTKLFAFFVNVVLNFVFIPIWGIEGAAIATLISQFVAVFLSMLVFKKTRSLLKIKISSILFPLAK